MARFFFWGTKNRENPADGNFIFDFSKIRPMSFCIYFRKYLTFSDFVKSENLIESVHCNGCSKIGPMGLISNISDFSIILNKFLKKLQKCQFSFLSIRALQQNPSIGRILVPLKKNLAIYFFC